MATALDCRAKFLFFATINEAGILFSGTTSSPFWRCKFQDKIQEYLRNKSLTICPGGRGIAPQPLPTPLRDAKSSKAKQ